MVNQQSYIRAVNFEHTSLYLEFLLVITILVINIHHFSS